MYTISGIPFPSVLDVLLIQFAQSLNNSLEPMGMSRIHLLYTHSNLAVTYRRNREIYGGCGAIISSVLLMLEQRLHLEC